MHVRLLCALLVFGPVARRNEASRDPASLLHLVRSAPTDLEITGLVRGLQRGQSAYVRYADLLRLPQVSATVIDNPADPGTPTHVSGVLLETVSKAVGALPAVDLIDARCADRYRSHFPAEYVAKHHPILVLKVGGKPLDLWARTGHHYDPSPYMVVYQHFVPSFKLLAHSDEEQLPDNLSRLNFTTQAETYGPIEPRGKFPPGSPEQVGFTIAKQNCLRCHFMGDAGGTKSGHSWSSLGQWAEEQPNFFEAYIKNPQKLEPHAHMEGSPQYDKPTLDALDAYFRTFADDPKKGKTD